jgi:hypothetical protein
MICSNVLCESFAESCHPQDASYPPLAAFIETVHLIQSSDSDYMTLKQQTTLPLLHLLTDIFDRCAGVYLFVCSNGHVGISYPGVRVGDTVSILLGCSYPMVLRPFTSALWKVVSVAKLAGLMNGEAIHSDKLP